MTPKDYAAIIPTHHTGEDVESEAATTLASNSEAQQFFETAKKRLLNVNQWHTLAGALSATFQLSDATGSRQERLVQKGDYLRVDIPGPGSQAGSGYDWVIVEELKEVADGDVQCVAFRVRPTANPTESSDSQIAHFYDQNATSNFIVTREGNTVTASIIDKNIKPNNHAESLIDKARDTVTGIAAIYKFSELQWQKLAEGLVQQNA